MERVSVYLSSLEEIFGAGHNVIVIITLMVVVNNFVAEKEVVLFMKEITIEIFHVFVYKAKPRSLGSIW